MGAILDPTTVSPSQALRTMLILKGGSMLGFYPNHIVSSMYEPICSLDN